MIQLPDSTQRVSVIGRTGSGKTVAGVWHLSNAAFDQMPFVVYDFKRDKLIAEVGALEGVEYVGTSFVPTNPGIYIVQPHPDDVELVQNQLMRIWERQNTGLFFDEGYMVSGSPNSRSSLRLLLTQGRSLNIPIIILSQRPVWLDRFVFSESDYFQVFDLNGKADRSKVMEYVPHDISKSLPEYHSYWHNIRTKETHVLKPVPTDRDVIRAIDRKLEPLRKRPKRRFV